MMKTLYLDCLSGISGDMLVGALVDLGVPPSTLEWELSKLDLGDYHMHFDRQTRSGIAGIHFSIHEGATHQHAGHGEQADHEHAGHDHAECCGHDHSHDHGHSHEHGHEHAHDHGHAHGRSHREIRELILASGLSLYVKEKALAVFHRIAVAEGKIHGVPPEDVTFHEVGALDSIADIVASCVGIEFLGIEQVLASDLLDGTGQIECAHGHYPLPAPATLEILAGIPLRQIAVPFELITPTGAALAAEFVSTFGMMPLLQVEKIGYGLGTRDLPGRPNVLRAVLAMTAPPPAEGGFGGLVTQIETHLDDMTPELAGSLIERCLSVGALDAFLTPIQMKKGRPGFLLTVLTTAVHQGALMDMLFRETTTFGLRFSEKRRSILDREFREATTPWGMVQIKVGLRDGEILQASPEYESCRELASKAGLPVRTIYDAALVACTGWRS